MTANEARTTRRAVMLSYGQLAHVLPEIENAKAYAEATAAVSHLGQAAGYLMKLIELLEKGERNGRA